LQMPKEQNLVNDKIRQNIQTFTLVSHSSDIELQGSFDII